jgi:uncharacterized protein (DUF952 family)
MSDYTTPSPPDPTVSADCIFHICSRAQAEAARASGTYTAPSLATEGFIHFSRAHQVQGVRTAFYAGQQDLVLLVVDPALLQAPLRYEAPAHPSSHSTAPAPSPAQRFPHLYGPLPWSAVIDVVDIDRFSGQPVIPAATPRRR